MSTSEFYLAAAESTNPNDTWWFLGFLPILLLVAFWIAALISIIFSAYKINHVFDSFIYSTNM
mgnify:CR=1 FL=1